MTNSKPIKRVMISSTIRDLPEHRKEVMDACLRQGMFPVMMEHLPASDDEAISASLKMVDEADIYVGVFAQRYGYVPKGHEISITEMEYNRAGERKIPRCIFIMHEDHPIKAADVERGDGAVKLDLLRRRLLAENIVNFFRSPFDLRAHVINSLSAHRESDHSRFHDIGDIPMPPEPYAAHPYTLLQTKRLIGRQTELGLLTDWVCKQDSDVYQARILDVVGLGGTGKSALAWKWFNDIAPQEMKPLAGRLWWSFNDGAGPFESFILCALSYVTQRAREEITNIAPRERENQLFWALNRANFLIVLDGLERILIRYAQRSNENAGNSQTLSRQTADPSAGRFLKRLAQVKNSRILVSSRLFIADLETKTGDPIPGNFKYVIKGLTNEDAIELWRAFGITGSRDELLPIFVKIDNHPLLIQSLAGEVKHYRHAPGNFEKWRKNNPRFDPPKYPQLKEAMEHVLEFALQGLDTKAWQVLGQVAAFRMAANYDTLMALLVGTDKACSDERDLDVILTDLEDRGLLGWDRHSNCYSLHPIVRDVVWDRLGIDARRGLYTNLHGHFEPLSKSDAGHRANSLQDLAPTIELYNTLIGLERYDDAQIVYFSQIDRAMSRLGKSRERAELLEMLITEDRAELPRLSRLETQTDALRSLAWAYQDSGQVGRSTELWQRLNEVLEKQNIQKNLGMGWRSLSYALRLMGMLHRSETAAWNAVAVTRNKGYRFREATSLQLLGLTLATRNRFDQSKLSFARALEIFMSQDCGQAEGITRAFLSQSALWGGESSNALALADHAWELAQVEGVERDLILAKRLQGTAALRCEDLIKAEEHLSRALTRVRTVLYVEEELPVLIALAELRRRQGDLKAARELLDDVWELAERGPYPLFHTDAFNVLAQIERDVGNKAAAVEAATKAFRLAWCDGEPYAYHWGLMAARKHLRELGAPEPEMPPFDESKYEPMPKIEINPNDEFHVDSGELE